MATNNPLPTVTLSAAQTALLLGQSTVLFWTSSGLRPDALVLTDNVGDPPLWVSNGGTQQQSITVTPAQTTTYTITLTDTLGRTATDSVTIYLPPTVSLVATAATAVAGSPLEISWTTGNGAVTLLIDQGVGSVGTPSGSISVVPTQNVFYSITATGPSGLTAVASVGVAVVAEPQIAIDATSSSPTLFASGAVVPQGAYEIVYDTGAWEPFPYDEYSIYPDIQSSNITWFGGGIDFAPGVYSIILDAGSMCYIAGSADPTGGGWGGGGSPPTSGWRLTYPDPTTGVIDGAYYVTDGNGNTVQFQASSTYETTVNADMINNYGAVLNYVHAGGRIGMYVYSAVGYDNSLPGGPNTPPEFGLTPLEPAWQVGPIKVTDTAGNVVDMGIAATTYASQSDAQSAAPPGQAITYHHNGGNPIGAYVVSSDYSLDVNGTPSPELTLTLPCPTATLAASPPSTIYAGSSSVLTWTTAYANSASIDQGIGSVASSGAETATPTSTTTYTLTATTLGFGFTSPTASATVTVIPLPAPVNVAAQAECGAIVLTWSMPADIPVTSFHILRGTSPGTETLLAVTDALSYSDAPPVAWTSYYYVIVAVNNAAVSAASAEVIAQSMAAPASAPAGISVSGRIPELTVTAELVDHTESYNLYRGTVSGGETIYQTGLAQPFWVDFVDDGVPSSFYYQFTAVNPCGEGPPSVEAFAIPTPAIAWESADRPDTDYNAAAAPPQSFQAGSEPASASWQSGATPASTWH